MLAAFQMGNRVQLWDVKARSVRTNLVVEQPMGFGGGAFSPDARLLAIVCQDDSIRLWDTTTARLVGECTGHKQNVFSAVFAPDGRTLASTSEDGTLKLWNVATQQELLTIPRLGGAMRELLFSPDGRYLVGSRGLASRTGDLRIYQAPSLAETDAEVSR
jgi:WD40 repeat protein